MGDYLIEKDKVDSPSFSLRVKIIRIAWLVVSILFFRMIPVPGFKVRFLVLRLFGACCAANARIYPSAKIWFPRNMDVAHGVTIGPRVTVYNQGRISIGAGSIISQDTTLCASTHDYNDPLHPLILSPITIGDNVWICAEAFIGPGVTVGEGAVVGARAVLMKDAEPWSVYAGNPAVKIKNRRRFCE